MGRMGNRCGNAAPHRAVVCRSCPHACIAPGTADLHGMSTSSDCGSASMSALSIISVPVPGILAGVILAVGRVVGETAALVYTAGTVADFPKGIFSSGRTLSVHMYELSREGFHTGEAYATSVILILVILLINWISNKFAKKIGKT